MTNDELLKILSGKELEMLRIIKDLYFWYKDKGFLETGEHPIYRAKQLLKDTGFLV